MRAFEICDIYCLFVFFLENGFSMYLWLGKDLSQDYLQALFQVPHASAINVQASKLPVLDNPISVQIRSIIDSVMSSSPRGLSLTLVRQQVDPWEVEFLNLLIEDKGPDALSYVDYLCQLHRQIYNEVHNT
jgi:protein transport protein SEC24